MSSAKKVERYRSFAVGSVRSWQCRSPKESFKPNHVTTNTLHEFGWPYRNPAPTYQQKLRNSHVKHKGLSRWCSQRFQPEIWLACTMNCGVISFSVLSSKAETCQSNSALFWPQSSWPEVGNPRSSRIQSKVELECRVTPTLIFQVPKNSCQYVRQLGAYGSNIF